MTTPQEAAAEVAERAGTMASMMHQRVVGVVENMSFLALPALASRPEHRLEVFGAGGGARVAATLSEPVRVRRAGARRDPARPLAARGRRHRQPDRRHRPRLTRGRGADPASPSTLSGRGRGLAGMQLGLTPPAGSRPMFGIGLPELVVIIVVAVVVFGPDRLPEFARQAGRLGPAGPQRSPRPPATTSATELGPEFADFELTDLDPRRATCASTSRTPGTRRRRRRRRCARASGRSRTASCRRTTATRPDRRPVRAGRRGGGSGGAARPGGGVPRRPGRVRPRRRAPASRWSVAARPPRTAVSGRASSSRR